MKTPIEFASIATTTETATPWAQPRKTSYEDLVLKPELAARRLRFPVGQTWLRIVPALKSSAHGWMMAIHALHYEGGRCAHPKTFRRADKCAFDYAYGWLHANHPESLYSKANKAGVRLLTDPLSAFWALLEEEGKTVARLFIGSGYDGSRGGAPGLGYEIWKLTQERDENGNRMVDPIDPAAGRLLCVEKQQPKGAKYPSYALRFGGQPAPVDSLMAKMEPEEIAALCPLEETVKELTEEQEWQCLGKVIAPEHVENIRASLKRAA